MKLSDGEKLILLILADMYKHLEIEGNFDPDFIATTIHDDHLWGFKWKYTGIPFEKRPARGERDRRLGELEPKLEQFAMNSRSPPQWIVFAHPPSL